MPSGFPASGMPKFPMPSGAHGHSGYGQPGMQHGFLPENLKPPGIPTAGNMSSGESQIAPPLRHRAHRPQLYRTHPRPPRPVALVVYNRDWIRRRLRGKRWGSREWSIPTGKPRSYDMMAGSAC
ncbi:hypothetical protein B0H10DRAFT_2320803 [Mycena sp. CBHHK59/15]|nr:hypothetical protein B0H10DRAFT_2320803 [Mycena sp. CBHHK59/15]